jgi:hypothetical protein
MYSTDRTTIGRGAFEETIPRIDLMPSRRLPADGISDLVPPLRHMGVESLENLRLLLRGKATESLTASVGRDVAIVAAYLEETSAHRTLARQRGTGGRLA